MITGQPVCTVPQILLALPQRPPAFVYYLQGKKMVSRDSFLTVQLKQGELCCLLVYNKINNPHYFLATLHFGVQLRLWAKCHSHKHLRLKG